MNPLLDLTRRIVIGHRGASTDAPENTMAAFEEAVGQEVDAIELDVHVTADDVPVVIHDATLDRTTDASGPVALRTHTELRDLDAGARFSPNGGRDFPWRGAGLRIPTLAEVLTTFPSVPVLIEIKAARAQQAVRRVLLEQEAASRCVLASFEPAALLAFREPPFLRGATQREAASALLPGPLRRRRVAACHAFIIPERYRGFRIPMPRAVAGARAVNRPVHVWTVDDPASARRLWQQGVSGIITNAPAMMKAVRDSMPQSARVRSEK